MNIHIPTPLRAYTGGQQTVNVAAATVGEALEQLTGAYPDLRNHLYTPEGKLRSFVNIYLNDDDIRYLPGKEAAETTDADELTIIPSIAGGGTGRPGGLFALESLNRLRILPRHTASEPQDPTYDRD